MGLINALVLCQQIGECQNEAELHIVSQQLDKEWDLLSTEEREMVAQTYEHHYHIYQKRSQVSVIC